ncbi:MAG: VRR-NUC domain-containing protein [Candidatus Margulisiibacteriota bacterium]
MTETTAKYKVRLKYIPKVSEHVHQCHYFNWIRYAHPNILAFAIPNGGNRCAITGAMLKREGVKPGIPDIMIASANGVYHGLFIEMKTENGRMTESQEAIKVKLESEGYRVEMCKGWEQAVKITQEYLK